MLWWSNYLHLYGSRPAADNAGTAAKAFFGIDSRFIFLAAFSALHINGIKKAAVNTNLAAVTIILIDISLVATFFPDLADGKSSLVYRYVGHAAITAALAAGFWSGHIRIIRPQMKQSRLFDDIVQL